ncbi:B-box domain protein 30-like [Pyrus x bretschneideri]|uniref:B-box domain protein 30-like n=1 Tax=Pyrus x bretschneideri TaxID=225117 RepID=UPI00202F9FBC|nr:B-box domain protein 30-like [Pyrus x bretschneideri]
MCKGVQESGLCRSPSLIPSGGSVCCELCNSRASLYCLADDAFLCRKCDRWVHGANFLALRHARWLLCNTCQNLTRRYVVGIAVKVMLPTILSRRFNAVSEVLKREYRILGNVKSSFRKCLENKDTEIMLPKV